jgi:hypothetical protein
MKITAPGTLDEYLDKTAAAVKHLYAGMDACWSYYREALEHWDVSRINQPMTPKRTESLKTYLELAGKHFDLKFSEAMFAGAVIQIAYMGVRLYSRNVSIPKSCEGLLTPAHKPAIRFCIGEERHGIPVGLIIYAARNQFNHWDDDEPREVTKNVFDALSLAFRDNVWHDLAFDLHNLTINVYANEVLLMALGWRTYDRYVAEMKSMLYAHAGSPAA